MVTGRAGTKSLKRVFFGNRKNILGEKIPLQASDFWVNPACLAGIQTQRPNFKVR
jgi:hypothetical protein